MSALRRLTIMMTLAAVIALAIAASPAEAAKRKVPFGFFSVVASPELTSAGAVSDAVLDQQLALMARSGVESTRITPAWADIEPARGVYAFSTLDRLVGAAARHRVKVLLNVTATPLWASGRQSDPEYFRYPPADPATFAELWSALVARYGPSGTFWAQNPTIPKVPVRHWQIWNEQSAPWHWRPRPWAPGYTKLLKDAYQAIKSRDRGATVVAGSVVASPNYSQWAAVRDLYKAGAKRWFDQLAVHPFTFTRSVNGTIRQVLDILGRVRQVTRRNHDGRVPIIVTELTWPASVGKVPRQALLGLETNTKGQHARLKAAYKKLAAQRRKLRVTEVYWYTWTTGYNPIGAPEVMSFRYSGLTKTTGSSFSAMPLLRTYTSLAAKYEGCRKSDSARRCR